MKDATLHKARDFALDLAERAARISRAIIEPPAFERKADSSPVPETEQLLAPAKNMRVPCTGHVPQP